MKAKELRIKEMTKKRDEIVIIKRKYKTEGIDKS